MSFQSGSILPVETDSLTNRSTISHVLSARAKFEATIRMNSLKGGSQSRTFLTNVAATPRRNSSFSLPSPKPKVRDRRQSSLTSVRDIEAEYYKITGCFGDDEESVKSLPANYTYQYAKDTDGQDADDISLATTIVSYNDAGDYMYFDACPLEEAIWKQQLQNNVTTDHGTVSRPPAEIRTGRTSPTIVRSPLSSPRSGPSESFRRKKRVFERHKHANSLVRVDLTPLLVKAAFSSGEGELIHDYCPCGNSVNSKGSETSSVSSLGDVLVDIYAQSMLARRDGEYTDSSDRSESPSECFLANEVHQPHPSKLNAVFTIIEEDEELSTSSSEVDEPSPRQRQRSSSLTSRASSPSVFLSRIKRSCSLTSSCKTVLKPENEAGPRRKTLYKRGITRSALLASRQQNGDVVY